MKKCYFFSYLGPPNETFSGFTCSANEINNEIALNVFWSASSAPCLYIYNVTFLSDDCSVGPFSTNETNYQYTLSVNSTCKFSKGFVMAVDRLNRPGYQAQFSLESML